MRLAGNCMVNPGSARPVPVDAELLLLSGWLRDTVTNEPLVSGQQLAAPSEEESSGRAIVSEFDLAAD